MAEYSGTKLFVVTIVLIPVQVICVGLRLFVRYRSQMKFGLDDLVVVVALMGQLALAGVIIAELKYSGIGYHIAYLTTKDPNLILLERKYRVAQAYIYVVNANLPKISILLLYRRLFAPTILQVVSTALIWMLSILIIGKVLLVSFVCRPFTANWDLHIPGSKCLNLQAVSSWSTLPNIITDVGMLLLPVPVIWSLHTKIQTKVQLTFTFALGSLGLVTSILRFQFFFTTQSYDVTWTAVRRSIWTEVEPAVYLICACIITYKPLLDRINFRRTKRGSSNGSQAQFHPANTVYSRDEWVTLE